MALVLSDVQAKLVTLQTDLNALLALPGTSTPVDLQPLGDAVDAIDAQIKAAIAAHTP